MLPKGCRIRTLLDFIPGIELFRRCTIDPSKKVPGWLILDCRGKGELAPRYRFVLNNDYHNGLSKATDSINHISIELLQDNYFPHTSELHCSVLVFIQRARVLNIGRIIYNNSLVLWKK